MRLHPFLIFLLSSLVFAQSTQSPIASVDRSDQAQINSQREDAASVNVSPADPVITINGFCGDIRSQDQNCKTVITREQFEQMADALEPGMSLELRLKVANAYARNLQLSAAAEKRGLAKTPQFEEEMLFARVQILAQDMNRALLAEANNISDRDLADYYQKNESSFVEATFARIFIPREKQGAPAEVRNQAEEMSRLAADLRARAVTGEDPDKLQLEAYRVAGIDRTEINTIIEHVRVASLPPQHESVMNLHAGEVSLVFSDPDGGHFIYKMLAKKTLNLDTVKPEIRSQIAAQRYRDGLRNLEGNVVFSDAYFNPPAKTVSPGKRNPK